MLIGHEWVLEFLRRTLPAGRVHHAYLLTGPAHIGKLTTAFAMAQVLMCPERRGCGACRHCSLVQRRIHPDLRMLQLPADRKNIPIKDVHEFMQGIALKPLEAERKVYVVDSADMLAEDGANAFLKTLEEPPPAVTLILTATDPARLLPTVVSRCQRISLRPVSTLAIQQHLVEALGIESTKAEMVGRASHGLPGWAILAAGDDDLLNQREARASELARLLGASRLERLSYADELAERWGGHSDQVVSTLEIWIDTWRDMARGEAGWTPSPPVPPPAPAPVLRAASSSSHARDGLLATLGALDALRANAHPRLTLENLVLFWPRVGETERG